MPALKSRNTLPSASSTIAPAPRTGANAYARGSEGLVTAASDWMMCRVFGPGISVTSCGAFMPASCSWERGDTSVIDDCLALLAQVLLHVVQAAARLPGRPRSLPSAERLHPRPRAGGRAGPPVHVDHAGLDPVEERTLLGGILRVEPRGQAVL